MKAAVARVAPAVVSIDTVGGLERVGEVLIGTGPTTGLIVSPEGYVVSSAFNFVQQPSTILVGLADGTHLPAELVATDRSRMLVLLKIDADRPLPVPQPAPAAEMAVGQWAIAVGRGYESSRTNVSVGVVSALDRVWGKALQTDAKISPSNYGGALVDIRGRVLGVLVPLSPMQAGEMAGTEWYDSGIGFAVPLEHVLSVLPRLQQGEDLRPGLLGISLSGSDLYSQAPVIAACRPNSPAYKAGLKPGDRIVEIEGRAIVRSAQLLHEINRRYAGDKLRVAAARGDERITLELELVDHLDPYRRPFLGILPLRTPAAEPVAAPADNSAENDKAGNEQADGDSPDAKEAGTDEADGAAAAETGVVVRFVYPDSPAARAGLLAGDRITSLAATPIRRLDELVEQMHGLEVGGRVAIELARGSEVVRLEAELGAEPAEIPSELPPDTEPPGAPPAGRPDVGELSVKVPEFANECLGYVPEDYHPALSYGLVVSFSSSGSPPDEQSLARWQAACRQRRLILLAPKPAEGRKWQPDDLSFVRKAMDQVRAAYRIDPLRVVAQGHESGGSMAYALAFNHRDLVRGVAALDAPLGALPPDNEPIHRLSFYLTTASKSQFAQATRAGVKLLSDRQYAVTVRDQGEQPRPLTDDEFAELLRWIDSLDKI